MIKLNGTGASEGISLAKALVIEHVDLDTSKKEVADKAAELVRFEEAIKLTVEQIKEIKVKAEVNLGAEKAAVFEAHIQIATDPAIVGDVTKMIEDGVSVEFAFNEVASRFEDMFKMMDDPYMQERAADVADVKVRALKNLLGIKNIDLTAIDSKTIIVAEDLTPSETSQLDKKFVVGFLTNIGGRTSHSAIMARTLEIPAVVGLGNITSQVKTDEMVSCNGFTGEVIVNPDQEAIDQIKVETEEAAKQKVIIDEYKDKEAITKDGVHLHVVGNIGSPDDMAGVIANGGKGVGLFRTEFLYMGASEWPSEEVQFESYKSVLDQADGHRVVIRTLDIGGDKHLDYYTFPQEMNPFLGYRAVRVCLKEVAIFKTQLRALLRASKFGKLAVNVPMIAVIEEIKQVKELIEECKTELTNEGVEFTDFELGIMVEIPSVIQMVDQFSKYVEFFSVGSNDLIQYTFAADRMSENVSYLYQPLNPAILRQLELLITKGHANEKFVGMCGEMAGTFEAIPLLIGLGLDEFSMSGSSIPKAKYLINNVTKADCEVLVQEAMTLETNQDVLELVQKFIGERLS